MKVKIDKVTTENSADDDPKHGISKQLYRPESLSWVHQWLPSIRYRSDTGDDPHL